MPKFLKKILMPNELPKPLTEAFYLMYRAGWNEREQGKPLKSIEEVKSLLNETYREAKKQKEAKT